MRGLSSSTEHGRPKRARTGVLLLREKGTVSREVVMSESEGERRPRPIGAADENDEDSDNDRNDPKPAGNETADTAAQQVAPEETTKKATSTRRPAFSENDLVKEKGLLQIYERFPEKCKYKGKGREVGKIQISQPNALIKPTITCFVGAGKKKTRSKEPGDGRAERDTDCCSLQHVYLGRTTRSTFIPQPLLVSRSYHSQEVPGCYSYWWVYSNRRRMISNHSACTWWPAVYCTRQVPGIWYQVYDIAYPGAPGLRSTAINKHRAIKIIVL